MVSQLNSDIKISKKGVGNLIKHGSSIEIAYKAIDIATG